MKLEHPNLRLAKGNVLDYASLESAMRGRSAVLYPQTTLARNPNCWMAYSNLGSLLAAQGNIADAMCDFRKALDIWPNQSKDHNNLGTALLQKGRHVRVVVQIGLPFHAGKYASAVSPIIRDARSQVESNNKSGLPFSRAKVFAVRAIR